MKVNPVNKIHYNQQKINTGRNITDSTNNLYTKSDIAALEQLGRAQIAFSSRDIMEEFSDDDLLYIDDTAEIYNFSEYQKKKFAEGIYDTFKYTDADKLSDFIVRKTDDVSTKIEKLRMRKILYEFINNSMRPDEQTAQDIYNSMQTRLDNIGSSYVDYRLVVAIASMYCTDNKQIDSLFSLLDEAKELGRYSSYFDIFKADSDKDMQSTVIRYMYKHIGINEDTVKHLVSEFMVTADEPEEYRYPKLKNYEKYEEIYAQVPRSIIEKSAKRNAFAVDQFLDEFFAKGSKSLSEMDFNYIMNAFFKRYPPEKCPLGENKDIHEIAKQVVKRFELPRGSYEKIIDIFRITDSLKDIDIEMINNVANNIKNPQKNSDALNWNHNKKYIS